MRLRAGCDWMRAEVREGRSAGCGRAGAFARRFKTADHHRAGHHGDTAPRKRSGPAESYADDYARAAGYARAHQARAADAKADNGYRN